MKRYFFLFPALASLCLAGGCKSEQTFDATGAFEAEETVVSSQSQGVILRLDAEEGAVIDGRPRTGARGPFSGWRRRDGQATGRCNGTSGRASETNRRTKVHPAHLDRRYRQRSPRPSRASGANGRPTAPVPHREPHARNRDDPLRPRQRDDCTWAAPLSHRRPLAHDTARLYHRRSALASPIGSAGERLYRLR